jgi:hypothetical protein
MTIHKLTNLVRTGWLKLWAIGRPAPIASRESLRDFVATRAAFVAQKVAVDYCRGKTGVFSHALFTEKDFQDALTVCRWESFAATLADLLVITEGYLRPAATAVGGAHTVEHVGTALARFYPEILSSYPMPAHRSTQGWSDVEAAFAIRFAAALAATPRQPADIANHSARRLFETLPIHTNMRELDEEIVHGAVRFRLVATHQELLRRAKFPELIAALAADRPSP